MGQYRCLVSDARASSTAPSRSSLPWPHQPTRRRPLPSAHRPCRAHRFLYWAGRGRRCEAAAVDIPGWTVQGDAQVRLEWGSNGVEAVVADFVVIVDVLRFTTAVEAATTAGAAVYPYRWNDGSAAEFASTVEAVLADSRDPGPSLSPVRLCGARPGDRIVLPSPNGSNCAAVAAELGATVVAACLRNVAAVASWLNNQGGTVAVIPCGERWSDGSLRSSLEDYLGAAMVVSRLKGSRSAEAEMAAGTASAVEDRIEDLVRRSASGCEMVARQWGGDLDYAVAVGASDTVPVLTGAAFIG